MAEEEMKKTSNVERPTLNFERRGAEFLLIGCSAACSRKLSEFGVRRLLLR
jgi:hypothetical protein